MPVAGKELRAIIREELADLVAIRRDLHAHPELGYEERRTSEVVQKQLRKAGVEFRAGLAGGTGVLACLPGRAAKAIGLRADMDALPIQEVGEVPYRSQCDGVMHACGHDGHTTMLIGAARVLARMAGRQPLPRPVTFVFQPAEEGGAGGKRMVEEGCLDGSVLGPPVEQMFGQHGWPRIPLGMVGTRVGPLLAATDSFDVVIRGVGSHAAWPHIGADPIIAASAVVGALQTIASRNVGPLESVVVSVTQIKAGTTHNIIPDEAYLGGTVRTLKAEVQDLAERRLGEIARGVAQAHGCTARVDYRRGYPATVNDAGAVGVFRAVAAEALGAERVVEMPTPVMGGEDFAFYGQVVPACFFVLGLQPAGGTMPDLHQPTYDFNDDAIATGVELFCRLALR